MFGQKGSCIQQEKYRLFPCHDIAIMTLETKNRTQLVYSLRNRHIGLILYQPIITRFDSFKMLWRRKGSLLYKILEFVENISSCVKQWKLNLTWNKRWVFAKNRPALVNWKIFLCLQDNSRQHRASAKRKKKKVIHLVCSTPFANGVILH